MFVRHPQDAPDGLPKGVGRTRPLELNIRPYLGCPHNVFRGSPQDVGRERPMALHIGRYGDVLRMLHWDVFRTSYFNVLWTWWKTPLGVT